MSTQLSKKLVEEFAARDKDNKTKWIRRFAVAILLSLFEALSMIDVAGVETFEEGFLRWGIATFFLIAPTLGVLAMIEDVKESRYRGRRIGQVQASK